MVVNGLRMKVNRSDGGAFSSDARKKTHKKNPKQIVPGLVARTGVEPVTSGL